MDMLTNIEVELQNAILKIDGLVNSAGYQFYNEVTIVNLEDDAVAVEYGQFPTVAIYLTPNEVNEGGMTRAYQNATAFQLRCDVAIENTEDTDNPRFQINIKLNELLSDIKAVLGMYSNLNCACDDVMIQNSYREYNTDGDIYRVAQLIVNVGVDYNQDRLNPNISCATS